MAKKSKNLFGLSDTQKTWLVSILTTFVAGFAIVVVPEIDKLTLASFKDGAFVGLIFTGVRTGAKALLEAFLAWYNQGK